ncbi:hypothetical protein ACHELO_003623 [Vibrio fluvialis]
MSNTLTNLEPHIYALRRALIGVDFDNYLKMFKLWKLKLAGREVSQRDYVADVKAYKVEKADDDCAGCKI